MPTNHGGADKWKISMTGKTGSCRYMAPEVWAARNYDHRADIFSFGVLAYEVLARKRAYSDKYMTMEQVAAAVEKDSSFRPSLPKAWPEPLADLISACWHEDPLDRPNFWEGSCKLDLLVRAIEVASGLRAAQDAEQEELGHALHKALGGSKGHGSSCCAVS